MGPSIPGGFDAPDRLGRRVITRFASERPARWSAWIGALSAQFGGSDSRESMKVLMQEREASMERPAPFAWRTIVRFLGPLLVGLSFLHSSA
jgi:hypothetical protein